MRAIFGLVLVVGIGLAGLAVFMVQGYMESQQIALKNERARAAQAIPLTEVIALTRPVAFGETIVAEDVQTVTYARKYLPEGTFATLEDLFPDGSGSARTVLVPMQPNEAILVSKLTAPGKSAGIGHQLRPLMRAFTINVDVSTGVSGFLRPSDRVDIYWTGNVPGTRGASSTHLIGSSVELVAVDQSIDANRASTDIPRTVTVQVSPVDVASLAQAQSSGRLSLALVGQETAATVVPDGAAAIALPEAPPEEVMIVEAPRAPAPAAPQACYTTVRRGTDVVQIPIPCSN